MLIALLVALAAQAPAKIDFVRDVQPILRERCVSCHGPDLRMGGLRLDRRADALRGGTQTDIGPGNADGSRLYHRVAGTAFGQQMPPTGALTDDQIDIIREWIDQGAEWPDDASGEPRTAVVDQKTRQLLTAALYGTAPSLQRLLATGASPNAATAFGVTPLMLAVPDIAKMQMLLDAGADVNARSDEGRSALAIAAGTVGAAPAVRLLLEYGADVTLARASDASPMREAMRVNDRDIQQALADYGALSPIIRPATALDAKSTAPLYDPGRLAVPTPRGVTEVTAATVRAAIERSLPLLQDTGIAFITQTGCVSCHHNSVVSLAVSTARAKGYTVNDTLAERERALLATYLESWRERALQNIPIAGGADTMSYLLIGLSADGHPGDEATDAQAIWIKRHQMPDGHWPVASNRPPIEW
ncbi:MAG TPA: c-type cytochrome domain-containing protein, partial [Vicinamibacterales bacterium]|nr:c-type cytochrome domain-containing protein [Vicinamibacterales bacterium]